LHEDNSWSEEFVANSHDKIEQTKSWMSDEKSVRALEAFMKQKQTCCYSKAYDTTPQYFDSDIIHYGKEEVFIDCGAYHGETSLEFIKNLKKHGIDSFSRIIAFEPDEKNAKVLKENLRDYKNVEVHITGVSNENGILSFSSGKETASKFVDDGDIKVPVEAIDALDVSEKITFIKMDIEGAELDALHGAANAICINRPKLAICVYHKKEDLITIPQYIKKLNPDYKLYFRNYNFAGTEAVLYAV
jgi:FkbM family methyltransferase